MLDAELFNKISEYISLVRRCSKPFGGIQIIASGDFCQLEPVNGGYCFKATEWEKTNFVPVKLKKLIRQDGDLKFQKMLKKLRFGICSEKNYQILSELSKTDFGDVKPTILYPRNYDVDKINKKKYQELIESGAVTQTYTIAYPTLAKNRDKAMKWLKSLEIPEKIELCEGAQVMVLANINQDAGIVNGTRGVITKLLPKSVIIKRVNGELYEIGYHKTIAVDDENISVSFMPLKLAYALTIHKSQGATLDAIEIDIGSNIFAAGQAYTALSRARDLNSVKIKAISKNSFIVDDDVLEFYAALT
jgi:ATP-dependent DNA helicase PIF1